MTRKPWSREDRILASVAASGWPAQALFVSLRLAGVTNWSWWAVPAPVLAYGPSSRRSC